MNRTLILIALAAAACGGSLDNSIDSDDLSSPASAEPMQWYAQAQSAAATVAAHPQLMHLDGTASGSRWAWKFTFRGDVGQWATVATDGKTAKVTQHWQMIESPLSLSPIDPANVQITVASLRTVCKVHGVRDGVKSYELDQPQGVSKRPQWVVTTASAQLAVDAATGEVIE
jgi:hypothetical protein